MSVDSSFAILTCLLELFLNYSRMSSESEADFSADQQFLFCVYTFKNTYVLYFYVSKTRDVNTSERDTPR